MRLRQRGLNPYTVKPRKVIKEPDATTYEDWDPIGHTIQANVLPANGRMMADMYGERLAYMVVAYAEPDAVVNESDGVCVYVAPNSKPDYKVVAVRRWSHTVIDLEAIRT